MFVNTYNGKRIASFAGHLSSFFCVSAENIAEIIAEAFPSRISKLLALFETIDASAVRTFELHPGYYLTPSAGIIVFAFEKIPIISIRGNGNFQLHTYNIFTGKLYKLGLSISFNGQSLVNLFDGPGQESSKVEIKPVMTMKGFQCFLIISCEKNQKCTFKTKYFNIKPQVIIFKVPHQKTIHQLKFAQMPGWV